MNIDQNVKNVMLGLLPFDIDCIDRFTPSQFLKEKKTKNLAGYEIGELIIPKNFHPIFHLIPWTKKEKDETVLFLSKLESTNEQQEKIKINTELNEKIRLKVRTIENLFDLGKQEFLEITQDKENNCVSEEIWKKIPEQIKTAIYFRISSISGLTMFEQLGL